MKTTLNLMQMHWIQGHWIVQISVIKIQTSHRVITRNGDVH